MASRREIIDRIEKLYALASGGTSPGEAAAAIAMAQKLAKKHGIQDSEINKHTYTKGTKANRTSYDDAADYWRKASGPSWDDYEQWSKSREQRRRKDYEDFTRNYYQQTFTPEFIIADQRWETEKAILLNIHLDESKYPWSPTPRVTVTAWMPKSQITTHIGSAWLLNKTLLLKNLNENIPWLLKNHPTFKNQQHVVFHFKEYI